MYYIHSKVQLILIAVAMQFPIAALSATRIVGPSDCSASAINSAISASSDGDTISITCNGVVTWNATISIPSTKGISLIGPGNNTPKASATFPLVITSSVKPAINITAESGRSLNRVSGFKFKNPTKTGDGSGSPVNSFITISGRGMGSSGIGAYRIDNNYFDHVANETTIGIYGSTGELTGLIDNNTFLDVGPNQMVYIIRIRETWKGGTSTCYGADAWKRTFSFGSSHFNFIEDNSFLRPTSEGRHDVSSDGAGGKFVVRYNIFDRSYNSSYQLDYVDAHGDSTYGMGAGARGGEIYGNTFQGSTGSVGRNINLRGGQWLVFDNSFTSSGFGLTEYRASSRDCSQIQFPSLCDSGVPQCATSSNFSTLYPLPGQIRGTYIWNNIYNGSNLAPQLPSENYINTYIKANRDYWLSTGKPTALSNYVPYTYPHPLRMEASFLPPYDLRL